METINHELINLNSDKRIINSPVNLGIMNSGNQRVTDNVHAAGNRTVSAAAVPTSEIWVLESVAVFDSSASTGREIYIQIGGNAIVIGAFYAIPANQWSVITLQTTLAPGDIVRCGFVATGLNSTLALTMKYRIIYLTP